MAVFDKNGNVICGEAQPEYSDSECINAFLSYMAQKSQQLGMSSVYYDTIGLNHDNACSPQDELKLAIVIAGNPLASDIWSTKDRSFSVGGSNARTISVKNNVYGAEPPEALYKLLGGKGGSLGNSQTSYWRKARMGIYDVNGIAVAVALLGPGQWTYSNMPSCTQELLGMMATKLNGGTPSEGSNLQHLITDGGGYAAIPVPPVPCACINAYTPTELLTRENVLSNNASALQTPASTTKSMTMICALDFLKDPFEVIKINSGDTSDGSGSNFIAGDTLNIMDALKIMMMESSNTLAKAVGRFTGGKILLNQL